MRQYRLKSEAVKFFNKSLATSIHPFDVWHEMGLDENALEEVKRPFITYGHKHNDLNSSTLSGWDKDGTHFHFTINFPDVKFSEHDKFSNGKVVRELMNKIQSNIDYFFIDFKVSEDAKAH